MKLVFCTNCNARVTSVACNNCFMLVPSEALAGTEFCFHLSAYRTPNHDEDGTWYCPDCNKIY